MLKFRKKQIKNLCKIFKNKNSSAYINWECGHLGQRYIKSSLCKEVLKLKQSFQKNKVVTSKTPFSVIDPFCYHHSICLIMGF